MDLYTGIGVVMGLAFVGAYMAKKMRQSVIIGYLLIGLLIGPNIPFELNGWRYTGLIQDTGFITGISSLGLIFLLFYIGLNFSIRQFRTTQRPTIVLAAADIGINMFFGLALGKLFGWPLIDSVFLAGVIAMSSSAVVMSTLQQQRLLNREEVGLLVGVLVVEDVVSILLLTFSSAFIVYSAGVWDVGVMLAGVVAFYAIFIAAAYAAVPRICRYIETFHSKDSEGSELFILFAVAMILLSSGLASFLRIPPWIGAFFIGVAFSGRGWITEQMQTHMLPFKEVFVAIFFLSFGMLIRPALFPSVMPMVAIAIPFLLFNEVLLVAGVGVLTGMRARSAVFVGAGLLGRDEEAVLYANVGSQMVGPGGKHTLAKWSELYPFAGAFTFIMSALTPIIIGRAFRTGDWVRGGLSPRLVRGAELVGSCVGATLMDNARPLWERGRSLVLSLAVYIVALGGLLVLHGWTALVMAIVAAGGLLGINRALAAIIAADIQARASAGAFQLQAARAGNVVAAVLVALMSAPLPVLFLWPLNWMLSVASAAACGLTVTALAGSAESLIGQPSLSILRAALHLPTTKEVETFIASAAVPVPRSMRPVRQRPAFTPLKREHLEGGLRSRDGTGKKGRGGRRGFMRL